MTGADKYDKDIKANVHNLRGISLTIPEKDHDQLLPSVSGSGKSSLALIQYSRRTKMIHGIYVSYARQF
jgi:excinuclease UvrABC ATPase subunit